MCIRSYDACTKVYAYREKTRKRGRRRERGHLSRVLVSLCGSEEPSSRLPPPLSMRYYEIQHLLSRTVGIRFLFWNNAPPLHRGCLPARPHRLRAIFRDSKVYTDKVRVNPWINRVEWCTVALCLLFAVPCSFSFLFSTARREIINRERWTPYFSSRRKRERGKSLAIFYCVRFVLLSRYNICIYNAACNVKGSNIYLLLLLNWQSLTNVLIKDYSNSKLHCTLCIYYKLIV